MTAKRKTAGAERWAENHLADLRAIGLKRLIFQARYEPYWKFYPKLPEIGQQFHGVKKLFPHWRTEKGLAADFYDEDTYEVFGVTFNNCSYQILDPTATAQIVTTETDDTVISFRHKMFESIKLFEDLYEPCYTRFGLRYFILIPTELTFGQLIDIFWRKIYNPDMISRFKSFEVENIAGYALDCRGAEYSYHVKFFPVNRQKSPELLLTDLNFPKLPKGFRELPEVGLFGDIDCYMEKSDGVTLASPQDFIREAENAILGIAKDNRAYILEE